MAWLIFLDTNVLLDFYRTKAGPAATKQLQFIDDNHNRIITGSQVQMEFMKHRQRVLIETVTNIKRPDSDIRQMPPVLVDAKPAQAIASKMKEIEEQQKKLRKRIERMLLSPTRNDAVYQCLQRLFKNGSSLNLSRDKEERIRIRALARKRFCLGYPPRKAGDTSIGDAVNWEWIIHCADTEQADVLIVSRDGDYGPQYDSKVYVNDWLSEEFKSRINRKRKIELTNRLTIAMDRLHVQVTSREKAEENQLLQVTKEQRDEALRKALEQIERNFSIKRMPLAPNWLSDDTKEGEETAA